MKKRNYPNPADIITGKHEKQEVQEVSNVKDEQKVQFKRNESISNITQGKKGKKLSRINMGFTDENHDYIKRISKIYGKSITDYVNILIEEDRKKNEENLKEIEKILNNN